MSNVTGLPPLDDGSHCHRRPGPFALGAALRAHSTTLRAIALRGRSRWGRPCALTRSHKRANPPRKGLPKGGRSLLQSDRAARPVRLHHPGPAASVRRRRSCGARLSHVIPLITHKPRILTQPLRTALGTVAGAVSPGQAVALAVLTFAGVAAFGITPDTALDPVAVRSVSRPLALPTLVPDDAPDGPYWREERVQRGDTIGSLLARAAVDDPDAMSFLRTDPSARDLYQLRPGRSLRV